MTTDLATLATAAARVRAFGDAVNASIPERKVEVACMVNALVQRQHVLLLGPPGAAKSLLARSFADGLVGSTYFETLFGRFSVPEEVFGPFSVAGLRDGRYERLTAGYLPQAEVAFLDEIFKANSAILNTLLGVLNERTFKQGTQILACPVETVIGASNELPEEGAGLEALADRFLFRRWVSYLADRDAWWDVVASPGVKVSATLDRADLAVLRAALPQVDVSGLRAAFGQLKDRLTREAGIVVSDRRWRALMGAVRAEAVLNGRVVAETSDLMILTDAIWLTPDQRPAVAAIVAACVSPDAEAAQKIVDAAIEAFATLDADGLRKGHAPAVTAAMRLRKLLVDATNEIGRLNQSGPVGEMAARVKAMRDQVARTVADAMTA